MTKVKAKTPTLYGNGKQLIINVSRNNGRTDYYEVIGNAKLLMMKLMEYTVKEGYYPNDMHNLMETIAEHYNGDCTESYLHNYVNTTLKAWSK